MNVNNSAKGREILSDLGKNALGVTTSTSVPTTIVGTKIIRGNDVEAILKAREDQPRE